MRAIIFSIFLATQLAVAALDYLAQQSVGFLGTFTAAIRLALQILSQLTLAALLWSMNYIGRGKYEVWGTPFEYVYKELVSRHQLVGLAPEAVRELELRNDFVSSMDDLDDLAYEHLKREMVKDQLFNIEMLDDPRVEVDDVIELDNGDRYYVVSLHKAIARGKPPFLQLVCWKIRSDVYRDAATITTIGGESLGYGFDYGQDYGEGL